MKNATLVSQYESLKVVKYFTLLLYVLKRFHLYHETKQYVYVHVISLWEAMRFKFILVQVITLSLSPPPSFFHSGVPLVKGFC